jgi:hypothetical protein
MENIDDIKKDLNELNQNYKINLIKFKEIYKNHLISIEKTKVGQTGYDNNNNNTKLTKIEGELKMNRKQFFKIKNKLQLNMNDLSAQIEVKNKELNKLTKENKELKQKIFLLTDRKQGSDGMIYDQKELYNQYNLGNWIIIILMFSLFYKVIKPQFTSENVNKIKTRGTSAMEALKM